MATGFPPGAKEALCRLLDSAWEHDDLRGAILAFAEAVADGRGSAPAEGPAAPPADFARREPTPRRPPLAREPRAPLGESRTPLGESRAPLGEPRAPLGEPAPGPARAREADPRLDGPVGDYDEDSTLADVVTRCLMKAEGARWAATRLRKIHAGVDFRAEVAPRDREVIDKAGAIPGCFLWTNTANFRPPEDLRLMESLAECFEVMADAVTLVLNVLDQPPRTRRPLLAQSLEILAETQSALRVAILRVGGSSDSDQFKVYQWIRQVANAEGHFIHRYMKLEDPADPERAHRTRSEIASLMAGFQQEGRRDRQRESRLKTLRFHASRLGRTDGDDYHWQKVVQTVHEAVTVDSIPPTSADLLDALLPIWDQIPEVEDPPLGFDLVAREVDRHLAAQSPPPGAPSTFARESEEVRQAARLLRGRSILMIGGHRQPHAQEALRSAFGLKELIWFESREVGAGDSLRATVARDDVALVLLADRWSLRSFNEVRPACDECGKPLVRLPVGYTKEQVAAQVLDHCGERLRAAEPGSVEG